jgi:hypothetical protein
MSRHAEKKSCPKCGAEFECLAHCAANTCWCMELPNVLPVTGAKEDCLCPKCLTEAINRQTSGGRCSVNTNTGF